MPPPEFGKPLEKQEVELIRQWIAAGAPPLKHWSFVPPVLSSPPTPDLARIDAKTQPIAQNWLHNAIDRFVLARQLEHGLAPSPTAARDVLLRRLSLDLVGLPPDAEMVQSFCADERPDALERVVDRLLASPAYGEHWARKWLDLARYADSAAMPMIRHARFGVIATGSFALSMPICPWTSSRSLKSLATCCPIPPKTTWLRRPSIATR